MERPRIDVRPSTTVPELDGGDKLERVVLADPEGKTTVVCGGLFSFIGAEPASDWLSGCAAIDDHGFALTDRSLTDDVLDERWNALGRTPLPFETSHPGLFAVGRRPFRVDEARRRGRRRRVRSRAIGPRVLAFSS